MNFELPNIAEDYVHRIGRTGRAGNEGEAMSLVCVDEHNLLKDIERLIKRDIPKDVIEGYEPDPSIKAEPINRGRGNTQQRAGKPGQKRSAGGKTASPGGNQRQSSRGRSDNQNRSRNQSRNRRRNTQRAA